MIRLALFGEGIARSLSPVLHGAALASVGLEGRYEIVDVAEGALAERFGALRRTLGGANVTTPHKVAALSLCDRLGPEAAIAGSVNTFAFEHRAGGAVEVIGESTDGAGLLDQLARDGIAVEGARVVVLGAGGAVRSVACALAARRPDRVHVSARDARASWAAVERVRRVSPGLPLSCSGWDDEASRAALRDADLIVQGTRLGHGCAPGDAEFHAAVGSLGSLLGRSATRARVVDLVYAPAGARETACVAAARSAGLEACDGRWMLVYQAARSFERWTAKTPDATAMYAAAWGLDACGEA